MAGDVGRVVVVGGGILGTMHALWARRRGLEVVQLERDAGPRSASVRNFGLVWVSGRAAGAELAVALRARELWEQIGAEVPALGFRPAGSFTVALDDTEADVLRGAVDLSDAAARGFELLSPEQARAEVPAIRGEVALVLRCTRDAAVEPGLALGALRDHLTGPGYRFLPGRLAVRADDGEVLDHTGERHAGDLVVLCPGATYDTVAAEHLAGAPLRRCRLQMCETEPLGEDLPVALADADSLRYYPAFSGLGLDRLDPQPEVAAEHRMQLLVVQRLHGGLTIGDTHAYDEPFPVGVDEAPYEHLRVRVEAVLGRSLPPIRRRWAGVYSQRTDDGICHRSGLDGRTWVVTGPGGRGMTLSPAIAEQTFEEALR
jgi:FAD dependent oxidoreductase TIGR03364